MRDESKEKQNGGSNGDAKSASQLVTAICSSLDQAMAKLVAAHQRASASNQCKYSSNDHVSLLESFDTYRKGFVVFGYAERQDEESKELGTGML